MFPARDLLTGLKPSIAELPAIDLRSSRQFEEEIGNASSENGLLLMVAEQIASRNDSPVFGPDLFTVNPDRQPLSETRMEEHTMMHAGKDRLAAIDLVVDRDPVPPCAAVTVSGDASVL